MFRHRNGLLIKRKQNVVYWEIAVISSSHNESVLNIQSMWRLDVLKGSFSTPPDYSCSSETEHSDKTSRETGGGHSQINSEPTQCEHSDVLVETNDARSATLCARWGLLSPSSLEAARDDNKFDSPADYQIVFPLPKHVVRCITTLMT